MLIKYASDNPLSLKDLVPSKILIVQTAFIGDVVLITPLIRESAKLFPHALIDVMIIPSTAPLLANNPYINELIVYDKRVKGEFIKIVKILRQNNYDIAITPHSSTRTAILLLFARIKIRIGYNRWFARHFLTHRKCHAMKLNHIPHKIEKLLNLLSLFTNKRLNMQTELYPSTNDFDYADKQLANNTQKRKIILIAPGSVWDTKRWDDSHFVTLIDSLLENDFFIILSGSPSEQMLCDSIVNRLEKKEDGNIINISGKTTLLETAALMKSCDLVICNDSGTLHMANAMQVKVFAFFGPTVQRFGYYPFREGDFVFEIDLTCRPCGGHGGKSCPLKHHNCMKNIEPNVVLQKVLESFS
ncbi:MAG: lipopolysaccharide heptosyltransferase II [Candidatus Cloacimonadales bacterium]|jgi:heptosyltransferase-2|nr:lipopolysaccharide heptosyltransferase II [Candidatus Cloacimonadota bacterium]MDD2651187.1 lipopolysaccharide heptosyltransferase II [Candidatus Cloacimonadota bacterium]MDD3501398.1 lipopolysaccharide heptosyltransferase II [Candidatus Cloacimonadota bacterium]MDX9976942.1 lipopolysaccharide heptosyltransferase II [Candidatus Cloacimonadales bacterium]